MELPEVVYLRHVNGPPIGPLPMVTLEVLFDGRVVDGRTPVSKNGREFLTISDWPALLEHLKAVKNQLGKGHDVWAEVAESGPQLPSATALETQPLLQLLLEHAAKQHDGHFILTADEGTLDLVYRSGKLVAIETTIQEFKLGPYLVNNEVCAVETVQEAITRAPQMGGDLGGALIASGAIAPHVFFEHFVAWAGATLARAVVHGFTSRVFTPAVIEAPPVPLGFDRLGILLDLVRTAFVREDLLSYVEDARLKPVIRSQVEGVTIEECKLKPKELRIFNQLNGVHTLDSLLDEFGGNKEKDLSVLRVIFFAHQCGFVVFGDDPFHKKEVAEAQQIQKFYDRIKGKTNFELFDVTEKATDEEVRTKYTEYAKKYHPDNLRAGAAEELVDARHMIFGFISDAFGAIETEDQRYQYRSDLDRGLVGTSQDLERVQTMLRAETLFKKAEILIRVNKYVEAKQHITEAINLNGNDIEFKIYRSYVDYLLEKSPETAKQAADKIKTYLKQDDNIASAYLLLGHLHKAMSNGDLSLKYFNKVLEYDERHPIATREVRLANMRKEKEKNKKKGIFGALKK